MNLETVFLNGVELQYLDQGSGAPVIFVHGALVDYRRWAAQFDPFAQHYRMIAYSRRYNYPNRTRTHDPITRHASKPTTLPPSSPHCNWGRCM